MSRLGEYPARNGPPPERATTADVRAANLGVVLRHVRGAAPCSRADIVASTGLNKATVSSLVTELIRRGLLRETTSVGGRIGRPVTMLVPDGQVYATVGIAVGADQLTAVAVDLSGVVLLSWRRSFAEYAQSTGRAVAVITALAQRVASAVGNRGRQVLGLTVGVPGLIDPDGTILRSPGLGWHDIDLRGRLETALRKPGYPITVENEANLAVLAEQRYGPYAEVANLVYLTGGTGIDASVVVDGRPLRGSRGYGPQIAHLPLTEDGPDCECGRRGCLEAVAGVPALIRRALPVANEDLSRADLLPYAQEILRRAEAKDVATLDALDETGRWLGGGVSLLAHLADPELIIMGGHFAPLTPWLSPAIQTGLAESAGPVPVGGCRIAPATLGTESAALGAAARVFDHLESGRLPA
ncbi:ROK family transcriptional regulator [Paractinoplanes rishiriensis]|uniref:Xylose repressor n=1 Tax=Paractinoplanes rishiriensis TaxID=1050105 RepID=A0A919K986_9ACTN|nr:ROK family transcriptional regulator [Actinoplanes rishiriensis]GIF01038.1 xylose repressor [Actinoplanes rishiriensis]